MNNCCKRCGNTVEGWGKPDESGVCFDCRRGLFPIGMERAGGKCPDYLGEDGRWLFGSDRQHRVGRCDYAESFDACRETCEGLYTEQHNGCH